MVLEGGPAQIFLVSFCRCGPMFDTSAHRFFGRLGIHHQGNYDYQEVPREKFKTYHH